MHVHKHTPTLSIVFRNQAKNLIWQADYTTRLCNAYENTTTHEDQLIADNIKFCKCFIRSVVSFLD